MSNAGHDRRRESHLQEVLAEADKGNMKGCIYKGLHRSGIRYIYIYMCVYIYMQIGRDYKGLCGRCVHGRVGGCLDLEFGVYGLKYFK